MTGSKSIPYKKGYLAQLLLTPRNESRPNLRPFPHCAGPCVTEVVPAALLKEAQEWPKRLLYPGLCIDLNPAGISVMATLSIR